MISAYYTVQLSAVTSVSYYCSQLQKDLQILSEYKLPLSGTITNIRMYVRTMLTGIHISYKVAIRLTLQ